MSKPDLRVVSATTQLEQLPYMTTSFHCSLTTFLSSLITVVKLVMQGSAVYYVAIGEGGSGITRTRPHTANGFVFPIVLKFYSETDAQHALMLNELIALHGFHDKPASIALKLKNSVIARTILPNIEWFYPVCAGYEKGVFVNYNDLKHSIQRFKGPRFSKITNLRDAIIFMLLEGRTNDWNLEEAKNLGDLGLRATSTGPSTSYLPSPTPTFSNTTAELAHYARPTPMLSPKKSATFASNTVPAVRSPNPKANRATIIKANFSKADESSSESSSNDEQDRIEKLSEKYADFVYTYIRRPSKPLEAHRTKTLDAADLPHISHVVNDYLTAHGYTASSVVKILRTKDKSHSGEDFAEKMMKYGPAFAYKEMKFLWNLFVFQGVD
ncbi:hypothetical protein PTI98_007025 [Pleurotus ostreatus]|nr:hypothetical protein PTI98_007025 [Pleurotus ostreatus]